MFRCFNICHQLIKNTKRQHHFFCIQPKTVTLVFHKLLFSSFSRFQFPCIVVVLFWAFALQCLGRPTDLAPDFTYFRNKRQKKMCKTTWMLYNATTVGNLGVWRFSQCVCVLSQPINNYHEEWRVLRKPFWNMLISPTKTENL